MDVGVVVPEGVGVVVAVGDGLEDGVTEPVGVGVEVGVYIPTRSPGEETP